MSLLRPVIRACALGALRNMTWAGTNVYDSDLTPLADAIQGKAAAPYIVCYTDSDDIAQVRGVAEIYDGDSRRLQVTLEIGVASAVRGSAPGYGPQLTLTGVVLTMGSNELTVHSTDGITAGMAISSSVPELVTGAYVGVVAPPNTVTMVDPQGNPVVATADGTETVIFSPPLVNTVQFAHTDFGSELAVDVTCAQAMAALIGDPYQPWGELFRRFVYKVYRVATRRGGAATGGIRFAARRITLHCSTNNDFVPGIVPSSEHPIWQFIQLARSNPLPGPTGGTITDMANILNQVMTTKNFPDWRQAQVLLGMTKDATKFLHVPGSPLPWEFEVPPVPAEDPDEFPPPFTDVEVSNETITPVVETFVPDNDIVGGN